MADDVTPAETEKTVYTQFSKKIVVAVIVAVNVVTILAMTLCWRGGEYESIVDIVKAYITFATIVFAAYCGNSAIEKWAQKKYGTTDEKG